MPRKRSKNQVDEWKQPLRSRKATGVGSFFSGILSLLAAGKTARKFPDPPILVLGSPRSGTSITITVLSAHPQLYCLPFESRMLTEWTEKRDGSIYPGRMYRLHRHVLMNKIPNGRRLVEKTPTHLLEIEEIERFYGSGRARYIHVLRDGRDVVLSKYPRTNVSPSAARWLQEVGIARSHHARSNFYTLRYESLVTEYESAMAKLCAFMEVDFPDDMKNWFAHKSISKHIGYGEAKPLFRSSVGKWKQQKQHPEVSFLNSDPAAREMLEFWGYEV